MDSIKRLLVDLWLWYMGYRWVFIPALPSGEEPPWEPGTLIRAKDTGIEYIVDYCDAGNVLLRWFGGLYRPDYWTNLHRVELFEAQYPEHCVRISPRQREEFLPRKREWDNELARRILAS